MKNSITCLDLNRQKVQEKSDLPHNHERVLERILYLSLGFKLNNTGPFIINADRLCPDCLRPEELCGCPQPGDQN